MKTYQYWVYIVTNRNKSILYVGITNDLARRLSEHFNVRGSETSFAGRYYCYNLIYFEEYKYIDKAIAREKQIKKWRREKKNDLITKQNPRWEFRNTSWHKE